MTNGPLTTLLDLSADAYHRDAVADTPTLSASIAKVLISQSALHAWTRHPRLNPAFERKAEEKYDAGTAAHKLLLEGENAVAIIPFDSWRTDEAKGLRDAARAAGKIPLLSSQWYEVVEMCAAVRDQLAALDIEPTPFTAGKPEVAIVWDEDGVACRALIDWLHDGYGFVSDMKTTKASANPESWRRIAYAIGADVQVAFHSRGVKAATGVDTEMRYVVVECNPPFAVSVVRLSDEARAIAEAKVDRALEMWRDCLESGLWPGYSREVVELSALPWETRWLDDPDLEAVAWEQM